MILSGLSLIWGSIGYSWNGSRFYSLFRFAQLHEHSVCCLWVAFQCSCHCLIVKQRICYCWVRSLCLSHCFRCCPSRFGIRGFLISTKTRIKLSESRIFADYTDYADFSSLQSLSTRKVGGVCNGLSLTLFSKCFRSQLG